MTAPHIIDPAGLLGEALSEASPDLMRNLLQSVINSLLSADAVAGAEWGKSATTRTSHRNGYRHRELDTRVGTLDVAIPKLRSGTYFLEWLLERRKRTESALITVGADCYLAGVSTRRMDKLVKTLGINALSKSQVSWMAEDLDEQVEAFRHRPLDAAGPFTLVAADALTMKVREGGRVVNAVVPIEGGYRMWFLATPHEVGPGERPDFELRVADSSDGLTWSTPRTFTSSQEGYFDNALYRTPDGWAMLLARGTNLHDVEPFPAQGMWWIHAAAPSGDRAAWSSPERILDTDTPTTPAWMGRGVCGPCVVTAEDDSMHLFFTGTHRAGSWWRESARRLLVGRRPPVPAPYHLATGGGLMRLRPSTYADEATPSDR